MLTHLSIQNFALIDVLDLNLSSGFTALTGETGSGKSILLDALDLVLGERADYSTIGPKNDKAVVEAEFSIQNYNLQSLFEENDLDYFEQTIFRREITKQGRSRAFINDSPVQLNVLKQIAEKLIHIHSQHNTLEIKNPLFQLDVIDNIGELVEERNDYKKVYLDWIRKKKELKELKEALQKIIQDKDYNQFLFDELEELDIEKYDFNSLEEELKKAENVDELVLSLDAAINAIDGDEGAQLVLSNLKVVLDKVKGIDTFVDDVSSRVKSILIELKDISNEIDGYKDSLEVNPEKIIELSSILDKYNKLLRKHNLLNKDQLLELKESLSYKLNQSNNLEEEVSICENELNKIEQNLILLAENLHKKRISVVDSIAQNIVLLLEELKMPNTQFEIQVSKRIQPSETGITDLKFMFSPNKGLEMSPIEKSASGGELSRIMLVIQKLISEKKQLPTIIFDEIDTGVSGEVAQKIGGLLGKMGLNTQLIAITHLPQVAAKAQNHIKVSKSIVNEIMTSKVETLSKDESIQEIARLMSGEKITDAALLNAKNLMSLE
jgi:DNA repair protein RecN (Recombination protein N)